MSIAHMVHALRSFLAENGMNETSASIILEFSDPAQAGFAREKMFDEFGAKLMMKPDDYKPKSEATIAGVPVRFIARIE